MSNAGCNTPGGNIASIDLDSLCIGVLDGNLFYIDSISFTFDRDVQNSINGTHLIGEETYTIEFETINNIQIHTGGIGGWDSLYLFTDERRVEFRNFYVDSMDYNIDTSKYSLTLISSHAWSVSEL